ncbi:MAG TPA: LEA type 2 family protein [Thermoanaerobaculia bacterium]|nr:LEA type 2 family protein [Thermoanaerobaculia bacterium]
MVGALVCMRLMAGITLAWTANGSSAAAAETSPSVGVELTSLELTALSEKRSEARAVLKISNPLASPVRLAAGRFVLRVNGHEVGQGSLHPRTLGAHKVKGVEIPIRIDRKGFLAALGGQFDAGMQIDAELSGEIRLRLPSGDLTLPLSLPGRMGTDGARSGVFAIPPGGGSLSPR